MNFLKPMTRLSFVLSLIFFKQVFLAHAQSALPVDRFALLTHEHTDGLTVLYNAASDPPLSLVAWQRDAALDLPTNQVIFSVAELAKLTLPAGTPFGDEGQPMWILPQAQNPSLLYLGINTGRVPIDQFSGRFKIQLTKFEGPGYFIAWQATGPGQYNIRIDTRDGIGPTDNFSPLLGAHEHFNWGFSAPGIYLTTFKASGRRIGDNADIVSAESSFLFQVLPLPPATNYYIWQKHFWPPGFNPPTTLTFGNSDADSFSNLFEYAFNLSPTNITAITNAPLFSFVEADGKSYGALTFTRYLPGADLVYEPEVTASLTEPWSPLTNLQSIMPAPDGLTERVTFRDTAPTATQSYRFYRVKITLNPKPTE
jgi:surface-anchored protein